MIVRTVKTARTEADLIMGDKVRHVFRSSKEHIRAGDIIQFLVYRDGKPVTHSINGRAYVVTAVHDGGMAPVQRGWQVVAFRQL